SKNAINLAMRQGAPINYSEEYQAPFFYYTDERGQNHVIWFEDSRSIAEKMLLTREYGLLGTGAWQVGLGFQPWPWLLTAFFNVRKVIYGYLRKCGEGYPSSDRRTVKDGSTSFLIA